MHLRSVRRKGDKGCGKLGAHPVDGGIDMRFANPDTDLTILKWLITGLYVPMAPSIWLLLRVASKVGAPG
jgi:hypothetical protein